MIQSQFILKKDDEAPMKQDCDQDIKKVLDTWDIEFLFAFPHASCTKNSDTRKGQMNEDLLYQVYNEVPRLLSLMDNRRSSTTYGCFYPPYWKEKKANFVNVRAQEASFTLALLYRRNYPNNPYHGKKKLSDFAMAGMNYWAKLQHKDGSFDEWRRYEHGQAGTAFSTFAVAETHKLINDFMEDSFRSKMLTAFRRSADFLCRNPELTCLNHEAVAIAALSSCYELLGDVFYLEKIKEKIELLRQGFSSEGWFREQDGPDSGYNTVTTSYLAIYYERSRDETVLPILEKTVNFFSFFLYPDGFTGGGFNSRCTGMLFPLGFTILSSEVSLARPLAKRSLNSIMNGKMNGLYTLDDMRKCITLYLLLLSYRGENNENVARTSVKIPTEVEDEFTICMKESGIIIVKTPLYYLVIGGKKGCIGAFFSYDADTTILMSSPRGYFFHKNCISGIFGKTREGSLVSNMGYIFPKTEMKIRKKSIVTKLDLPLINPNKDYKSASKNQLIYRPPILSLYHVACEIGFRPIIFSVYNKFYRRAQQWIDVEPVLRLIREIEWKKNKIILKNEITFLKPQEYTELYLGETFLIPQSDQCKVKCVGDEVIYMSEGKEIMSMTAIGKRIKIKSGEKDRLRFNDAQPIFALVPISIGSQKTSVNYVLELV